MLAIQVHCSAAMGEGMACSEVHVKGCHTFGSCTTVAMPLAFANGGAGVAVRGRTQTAAIVLWGVEALRRAGARLTACHSAATPLPSTPAATHA